jgi:hypothetical protein
MPLLKQREELSPLRVAMEPKRDKSVIQLIMAYDLCGWKQGAIAEAVGLTQSRVSIIMNSPLYLNQRQLRWNELQSSVVSTKATDARNGDPVIKLFKESALNAAQLKIELAKTAESETVRNSALSEILDRAGYETSTTKVTTSIEVSEKIADRFEKALKASVTVTGAQYA